ncbi:hypothetical protein L6452_13688 [Arctium lappa]|uniref:Uncharacterized protein n=1 Tax=Arctium lappa TaxID=4217 RepID=A0ACB9CIZ5_ARCLA|nr:hypothetical protein L6452_13688 [Arctium lappa]
MLTLKPGMFLQTHLRTTVRLEEGSCKVMWSLHPWMLLYCRCQYSFQLHCHFLHGRPFISFHTQTFFCKSRNIDDLVWNTFI